MIDEKPKSNETYLDKLKKPKWQKLRLKILERDDFTCQICSDDEETLHVHHKYYVNRQGVNPWDYPEDALITLCANCHKKETDSIRKIGDKLMYEIRRNFLSEEINKILTGFEKLKLCHTRYMVSSAIEHCLSDLTSQVQMVAIYTNYLGITNEETLHGGEVIRRRNPENNNHVYDHVHETQGHLPH